MPNYISDDIEFFSDSDKENSDEENSDEESSVSNMYIFVFKTFQEIQSYS